MRLQNLSLCIPVYLSVHLLALVVSVLFRGLARPSCCLLITVVVGMHNLPAVCFQSSGAKAVAQLRPSALQAQAVGV